MVRKIHAENIQEMRVLAITQRHQIGTSWGKSNAGQSNANDPELGAQNLSPLQGGEPISVGQACSVISTDL